MSAGAVFQRALRVLVSLDVPPVTSSDLLAALEAGRRKGPLALLYEAASEAGLEREALLNRAAGIYLAFCAGNLCDDLIDGDCTYLSDPALLGPSAQFMLQHASYAALLEAGIPAHVVAQAARETVRAAGYSHIEVRTTTWTAPVYREVVERIAGRQWSAYLRLLWWNTPLEDRAERVGLASAIAGNVAKDMTEGDSRWAELPPDDKQDVAEWARNQTRLLSDEKLRCLDFVVSSLAPVLNVESTSA